MEHIEEAAELLVHYFVQAGIERNSDLVEEMREVVRHIVAEAVAQAKKER